MTNATPLPAREHMPAFSYFLETTTDEMQKDAIRAYAKHYAESAIAALGSSMPSGEAQAVDCIGLALDLESQSKRVESQTVERAMNAAANGLRILAAATHPTAAVQGGLTDAAIKEALYCLGSKAPKCSGCEYEWNRAITILRAALSANAGSQQGEPECPKCHGRGWTEEGDPEAGGDMRPCECRGIGKPAVPWPWKNAREVIQEAIDHMGAPRSARCRARTHPASPCRMACPNRAPVCRHSTGSSPMTDTTETHKAIRKALAGVEAAKTPQQFDIAEVAFQRIKFPMLVALLADRDRLAAEVEGWKRTNEAEDEAYTALLAEADALKAEVEALTKAREPAQVAPEFQEEVDRMSREAVTLWQAANLDAKRYRWLRTWTVGVRNSQRQSFSLPDLHPVGNIMKGSVAQHFDAAIDAQIAAPPSPGTPVREGGE